MGKTIQAIRGMNDLLPDELEYWHFIENMARDVLKQYGYSEIRLPLLEQTDLFARSIGDVTDIVEKEMYTFEDRNGDSLTLRPEGTAGCVRAGIQHGLLHNQMQRLWYAGPMFRHERPQKGRYRQFHQIGVETFGFLGPDIDAELIMVSARLWRRLGLKNLKLELNSLGDADTRARHKHDLVAYFQSHRDRLDEDSIRRLDSNPLRILDSKNDAMQKMLEQAPSVLDYLDDASAQHFAQLKNWLDDNDIKYTVNPRLVRGLDYYSRTVFEWTTDKLGAQSAVCAGGRFDSLVQHLGGKPVPAAGFAIGIERLVELVRLEGESASAPRPSAYIVTLGEIAESAGIRLAESLRDKGLDIALNCGGGSAKSQMKRADRSGARYALILGEDECRNKEVTLKDLRKGGDGDGQQRLPVAKVAEYLF